MDLVDLRGLECPVPTLRTVEAVKKARKHKFDLIFMDIHMPNMNGYEATRILRKKGIATTLTRQLILDSINIHHLSKLTLFTHATNVGAQKVYERLGELAGLSTVRISIG